MQIGSDSIFESHIRDLVSKAKKTGRPVFSNFLSDRERMISQKVVGSLSCDHMFFGGYPDADNVMLSVFTGDAPSESDFPISCIKITVTNKNADLKHGDYMGAVMALGIERDVFGDIISYPTEAYIYVSETLSDYFVDSLTDIGREKCILNVLPENFIPDIGDKFSDLQVIISSDRLDCYISALCRLSREKSAEAVRKNLSLSTDLKQKIPQKSFLRETNL